MLNVTDDVRMQADDEAGGDEDRVEELLAQTNSPEKYVALAWPSIKPEVWQAQVLQCIGEKLSENARLDRWKAIQIAVASGNGVGKSALLSWLIIWALTTFEDCLGVVTAGTEGQLRTRLWSEVARWHGQLPEDLRSQFQLEATSIFNRQSQRTWRIDARPWSERNQEAFSGLHNFQKRVLVVMDECSMIADNIWTATQGMLSDAATQIIWIVTGNPTRLSGRFPMCLPGGRESRMWRSFQVDSRTVNLTDKESLNEKISYYGEDSNYVRVHIRGLLPTASTTQLIPSDWVEGAAVRETFVHPADAVVLGVDVASGHSEDSSCIVIRQGLDARTHGIRRYPTLNPLELAFKVAEVVREVSADAVFIDAGGLGEATVVQCRSLGLQVHGVYFAGRPDNASATAGRAANKRAECWLRMREWLRAGAIVNDATLKAELTGPEYSEAPAGILLERKADMRSRGLASPDSADALSLTFASPVWTAAGSGLAGPGDHLVTSEYNPWSDEAMQGRPLPELKPRYCAPGWSRMKEPEREWDPDEGVWTTPDAPVE
jgi:hypothetical protein